ncbi:phosphatidate phosphatase PAH1 [Rhodamnia argentea]|uniref:phosphatidate phosphatase n=1 Tax=Rhodamnia argentea TaxID=178133 RepID=A0ABM3GS03_9MYRT|nr:phosphatidate phosphatase PAH1 [Rhodamnia argentea]XP_048127105.1 phosphatidate phosphatase PAH1 [Rhodamnia argentea]
MNVVGKVGSLISQGVYSVATPFHPFGGAVDIIVVQQQDGSFRSTPWYVRFGKFQGVLKGAEKIVRIGVNGVEANNFHMHLDNSGEACFVREVDSSKESSSNGFGKEAGNMDTTSNYDGSFNDRNKSVVGICRLEHSVSDSGAIQLQDEFESPRQLDRSESDGGKFYDFQDEQSSQDGSVDLSEYGSNRYRNLEGDNFAEAQSANSEVVLISVDGHVLTAPLPASERETGNVELNTPQFHLGPGEGTDFVEGSEEFGSGENAWASDYIGNMNTSTIDVVRFTNKTNGASGHVLGVYDGEGEHASVDKEPQNAKDLEGDTLGDLEDAYTGIKREDVFKSCSELQELANQSLETDITSSSAESDTLLQKASQTLAAVAETENDQNIEAQNNDDISPSPSLGTGASIELKVDVGPVSNETSHKDFMGSVSMADSSLSLRETEVEKIGASLVIETMGNSPEDLGEGSESSADSELLNKFEISLCQNELHAGMGLDAAAKAFNAHRICAEEFLTSMTSIVKNENLVVRYKDRYLLWEKAAPIVLGVATFDVDIPVDLNDTIPVEPEEAVKLVDADSVLTPTSSGRRWRLWHIPFRRVKTLQHESSNSSNEETFLDSEPASQNVATESTSVANQDVKSPHKQHIRTKIPTSEQIASLNLEEGQNKVTFSFSTRVLGTQQVDAHIYLWKWNAKIVISDVDGTITKSDVLGQFMPLVGRDWTQSGVARLFSAIKENGYQLLFLSARAIVQAYLTRSFLLNLKQDGKALPNGPVVISPDGLFPSLYREVIRRAPHEFKIACLEDIKALFPSDYNPFYAGFGNRDTDELSYRKIGIPKGKIFIINPKGEVAISHRIDVKSYTSLHTLVNDMFPPTSLVEQEDYNAWNYWRFPLPDIES